jgi:membrane protease YdiL (CAAX protease family)
MFFKVAEQGRNEFWRYFISVIIIITVSILGQIPLALFIIASVTNLSDIDKFQKNFDFSEIGIDPNIGLLLMLIPFILCFLCMIFIIRVIHKRPFLTVLTGHNRFNWPKFFFAFFVMLLLMIIGEAILYSINPGNYVLDFNLTLFIPLLLISIFLLPFQTSFEEIFIRGYLLQGIGLLTKYKWIPLLLTSIVFGLLHYTNPEVKEYGFWLTYPYYFGFGLFLGIITILDNGLEIPLGIHAIVNIYGTTLITFPSSTMQTPAVCMMKEYDPLIMMIMFVLVAVIFFIIAEKKYNWVKKG